MEQLIYTWLNDLKSELEKQKGVFLKELETDPQYAFQFCARNVLVANYNHEIATTIESRMRASSNANIGQALDSVFQYELSAQLKWSGSTSASQWVSAAEEAEAVARTRWLQNARFYLQIAKEVSQ